MISSSSKLSELSPETFAAFLARLSPDPMQAGEAYEEQRQMLVKFFECRGVTFADDLADEVFNRVARRLAEGEVIDNLPGYCFSIARFILMERSRSPEQRHVGLEELPPLTTTDHNDDADDSRLECLHHCLQTLPNESRALIYEYYQDEKRTRIDVRDAMAKRLGVTRNALSNRMLRLRTQLEHCITRCVKNNAARNRKP